MDKLFNNIKFILLSFISSLIFFINFNNNEEFIDSYSNGIVVSVVFIAIRIFTNKIFNAKHLVDKKTNIFIHIYSVIIAFCWLLSSSLFIDNTFGHLIDSAMNVFKSILYFIGSYYLLYVISIFIVLCLTGKIKLPLANEDGNSINYIFGYFKRHNFVFVLIILLCWLPYIIVSYPAILDWDGWHSITIYLGIWEWTNFLHIFHTLFIGLFVSIGELIGNVSIGLYMATLLQVLVYLLIINESFKLLLELNVNSFVLFILLIIYCISPYYANFSSALIKDGIFSAFLMLFLIELIRIIEWTDKYLISKRVSLVFFISSMGVLAFRKNGMHIYVCMFVFTLLYFYKKGKFDVCFKKVFINYTLPIILICLMSLFVTYKTNALRGSLNETLSLPYQQTARYLKYHPDDVTGEEKEIISKVLLYDQLPKVYDPMISDKVKNSVPDKPRKTKDMIDYLLVWFKMFFKHPETYFAATFNQNYPLIYPFYGLKQTYFSYDPDYTPFLVYNDRYKEHKFELHTPFKKQRESINKFAKTIFDLPIFSLFCNISIYALISIFLFLFALMNKHYKSTLIFITLIFSIIIIILSPTIAKMPRYGLPIYYLLPIAISYLFYEINNN